MTHVILLLAALAVAFDAAAGVRLISRELPNGVRVVLAPDIASDKVAIHVTFDAGSRHDQRNAHGTAWLANGILGRRLAGFDARLNQERSYLASGSTTRWRKMTAVTREDVLRVARKYLRKSNRVVVLTTGTGAPR